MKESEFERRFLEFVYRTDLAISPSALAYYVDVPIAEAEEHLKKLVAKDVVKMDFSATSGDLSYTFPNRQTIGPPIERLERLPPIQPPRPVMPMPVVQVGSSPNPTGIGITGRGAAAEVAACAGHRFHPLPVLRRDHPRGSQKVQTLQ